MNRRLRLYRFGVTPYDVALRWQKETAEGVRHGDDEALALLQHEPVYTFGRRVRPEHVLAAPETLKARGAAIIETNRGGDVTFHGPGQLLGYPILDLSRRRLGPAGYVRLLEGALIETLARFAVPARRVHGRPGVWTARGKIGAIGVRLQGGVTTHGFALNVDNDLSWFDAIVPCGIAESGVASVSAELGHSPGVDAVADVVAEELAAAVDACLWADDEGVHDTVSSPDHQDGSVMLIQCRTLDHTQFG